MKKVTATVISLSPLRVREVNMGQKPEIEDESYLPAYFSHAFQQNAFKEDLKEWQQAESSLREWDIDEESLKGHYPEYGITNEGHRIVLGMIETMRIIELNQQLTGEIKNGKFYIL